MPRLRCEVLAGTASAALLLGLLAATGRVATSLEVILHLTDVTAADALGTPLKQSLSADTLAPLILAAPLVMTAVGLFAAFGRSRAREPIAPIVPVLVGLGAVGVLYLQKELIRGGMLPWVTLVGVVGVGAVLSYASRWRRKMASFAVSGSLLALLFVQLGQDQLLDVWWPGVQQAPRKAASAIGALTVDRKITPLLRPGLTAKRLTSFPHETVAATEARGIAGSGKVYVLGDAGLIYAILGQRPYWQINNYDSSPYLQQRRVVAQLESDPPAVVLVDRRDLFFDGVPNVLRTPLVHDFVVERYQFSHSVGQFDVLLPSRVTQPDWPYWTELLGDSLPLGRLPAATTAQTGNRCLSSSPDCAAYLRIGAEAVTEPTVKVLDVTTAAGTFAVSYEQRPGDGELYIPLGRLWFSTDDEVTWQSREDQEVSLEHFSLGGILY